MEKGRKYLLKEVIEGLFTEYSEKTENDFLYGESWCLYAESDELEMDSECYLLDYPDFDDDTDEELLPEIALHNGLECIYRDELIKDVLIYAKRNNKSVSVEELYKAIVYYDEHDDFMDM